MVTTMRRIAALMRLSAAMTHPRVIDLISLPSGIPTRRALWEPIRVPPSQGVPAKRYEPNG